MEDDLDGLFREQEIFSQNPRGLHGVGEEGDLLVQVEDLQERGHLLAPSEEEELRSSRRSLQVDSEEVVYVFSRQPDRLGQLHEDSMGALFEDVADFAVNQREGTPFRLQNRERRLSGARFFPGG